MSGHSKWANIKRHKAKVDAVKGSTFSRLIKEVMAAAKHGGPSPDTNLRLRVAIQKAKESNVPSANVERAIRRATGQEEGVHYESTVYEGYGPAGTAVYLDILTDNRNRTAGEIRHIFAKHGGSLGETGCVAWMFEPKGRIALGETAGLDEEGLLDIAVEAGADDLRQEDDGFVVYTAPETMEAVRGAFVDHGIEATEADLVRLPKTTAVVSGDDAERLLDLLEILEDHDDVEHVYSNAEFPESDE